MEMRRDGPEQVTASMSYDEAIVLFEMLGRWEWSGVLEGDEFWEDAAEQRVLWDLHSGLEPVIDESFTDAYSTAVRAARAKVRDHEDDRTARE